jgi:putative transposase
MPTKRPSLINNEIYHIVIRGVEDSLVFKDESDYYRGIFSIYEFNNTKPVVIRERRKERVKEKQNTRGQSSDSRDLLVGVLAFCFMPNHIHLLLKQLKDDGISKFMRKVGTGYASYFNKKYRRMGHLFQARFGAVYIKTEEQFKNVFVYIHTNPTSLIEPNWKEKGIKSPREAVEFLEKYRWSSYLDYIGKKNFPSVTNRQLLSKILDGEKGCQEFIKNWILYKAEIQNLGTVAIE